jgi:hypothetical protein
MIAKELTTNSGHSIKDRVTMLEEESTKQIKMLEDQNVVMREMKDQNKDDKNKDQNKDQQSKNQDKKDQQQKGQQPKLSKEEAEKMLQALQGEEQKTNQKMQQKQMKVVNVKIEKDW